VDGFHHSTATFLKGNNAFLDLHGAWARYIYTGPHYFSIVRLLVYPSLTVKKSTRTINTCMP